MKPASSLAQIRRSIGSKPVDTTAGMPASQPPTSHVVSAEEQKSYVPLFVPMGTPDGMTMNCRGNTKVPVHNVDIITRGDVMKEITEPAMRSGNFGAVYKAYVLAVACFLLMLVSWAFLSVYVAAFFAYCAGYYYSERLLNNAWGINWFKGKTLVYTT